MEAIEQRFWSYALFGDGCWEWQAGRNQRGYGLFQRVGSKLAHRIAWEFMRGPIPDGMHVLHICDNPCCVRPSHLFLGTDQDNVYDCIRKGRFVYIQDRTGKPHEVYGERHHRAKVTRAQVDQIRSRYKPRHKKDGIAAMAREFGLNTHTMWQLISGRTWKR